MKKIKNIINDVIREDSRVEALDIINMANEKEKKDFTDYYENNKHNICCLLLDSIKDRLVDEGKMKKGGDFGNLTGKLY